jgi:hypothetical protein
VAVLIVWECEKLFITFIYVILRILLNLYFISYSVFETIGL